MRHLQQPHEVNVKPTLVALLALCLCVAGCSTFKDIGRHLWGSDSKEGQSTPEGINQTSKVKVGTPIWEFETGGSVESSPAISSDGTVYVGSRDKKLYALSGKSGVKLWEFETGDAVGSSPAIGSDGTLYVGSNDYKVYAIRTGSEGLAESPWPMRGQNPQHTGRAVELISTEDEAEVAQPDKGQDGPLFDPNCTNAKSIESAVREKLKTPEGDLDKDTLCSVKKLKLGTCGLQDLISISTNLPGLKNLDLNTNAIAELTPLASLPKLEKLNLNTNNISRLNPLSELTELERLSLNNNQIKNLKTLAPLEELEQLSLNTNFISDLTPLENLNELEELHLSTNQITDLGPLSGLTELKELSLNRNQISDLEPLSDLSDLKLLRLSNNQITTLSPLHELRKLETVWIRNNPGLTAEEVDALKHALPNCEISHNEFPADELTEDLTPADEPTHPKPEEKISELCRDYPELALIFDKYDLNVEELGQLVHLDLAEWDIGSIKFLSALPALRSLDLDDNHISDLTPLMGCTKLESLSLNSNRISDLTPLAGLEKLQKLEIQDNLVQDLSPLAALRSLEILCIQNNRVQDRTVLEGLPNLTKIFDAENPCAHEKETETVTEETVVAEQESLASSELEKEYLRVVAERLGYSIDQVKLESKFSEDLGVELIDLEDLRLDINRHWNVGISDEDIQKVQTCCDLFRFVEEGIERNGEEGDANVEAKDTESGDSSDDENEERDDDGAGGEPDPNDDNPSGIIGETTPPPLPEREIAAAQEPPYPPLPRTNDKATILPSPATKANPVEPEEDTLVGEQQKTQSGVPVAPPMSVKIRPSDPIPGARSRSEPVKIKLPDHIEAKEADKEVTEIQLSPDKAQELVDGKKKTEEDSLG